MVIVNFSHPLTSDHLAQVSELVGQAVEQVFDVVAQVNFDEFLAPQVVRIVDSAGLTSHDWQTQAIILNLPALSSLAGAVLAEIHGRAGYFPPVIRMKRVEGTVPVVWKVDEIVNLQALRDDARRRR